MCLLEMILELGEGGRTLEAVYKLISQYLRNIKYLHIVNCKDALTFKCQRESRAL